jgi:hypothetical protein
MTIHDNHLDQVIEHVDQRRRGFLRNLLAGGAALVAVPAMSTYALGADAAAPAGKGGKGKGGAGGPAADPETLAARMIQEFDKDGDKALNQQELTAAIRASHERAGQGKGGGAGGAKGKGGGAGGGKGKGGGAGGGKGKGGRG